MAPKLHERSLWAGTLAPPPTWPSSPPYFLFSPYLGISPNALEPLIVAVTLGIPTAIFAEAGLSFLGFGINDPLPSWGKMIADSLAYVRVYWYLAFFRHSSWHCRC